ncbi:MAG: flagellar hook capping protein [Ruminiclostridium sp.]|nr:flagellar hook capping protein [Ruminiclostridium sp.]
MSDFIEGIASPQSNYEKYKDMFTDKHDLITMDNFYSLLVAEMQNQDPLEPTSNTEFISQMASFTALSAQQDTFEVQQQSYANSLIGKSVTVSVGDGNTETGVVEYAKGGDNPQISVNGKSYNLSSIVRVNDNGAQQVSGIGDYGAFAAGILGKTAIVQSVDATGMSYLDEGKVDSLEIENGTVRVVVNGYAYDATDVVRVSESESGIINGTQSAAQNAAVQASDEDDIIDSDDSDIYELFE